MSYTIVEVPITKMMRITAQRYADDLGRLKNSITKGAGNLAGFLGEVGVAEYLRGRNIYVSHSNTFNYDLLIGRYKVDVKTKRCTSKPQPHYECSVANFNTRQRCDRYVFTRVSDDTIYLLGYIDKEEFYYKSTFHRKGEQDTNIVGGKPFTFHADCHNIRIDELTPFKT